MSNLQPSPWIKFEWLGIKVGIIVDFSCVGINFPSFRDEKTYIKKIRKGGETSIISFAIAATMALKMHPK